MDDTVDDALVNKQQMPDDIARRYNNRLGYDLVDYKEVGLPFYKIQIVTLFQVRKSIQPIEEFILKSINIGLVSTEDISNFLGLDSQTIIDAMSCLRNNENIDLLPNQYGQQIWKITKKGEATLREAATIVPDERTIPIYFDGLLRVICLKSDLLKPKEIKDKNSLEIAPFPSKPPELFELNPKEADEVIRKIENQSKRKKAQDLIAFKSIERRERFYQLALALIYKSKDKSNEIQVTFVVDGVLSPKHEDAFARSGQIEKFRISEQLRNQVDNPEILAKSVFGPRFIEQVKNGDILENELLNCKKNIEKSTEKDDIEKLQQRIEELEKKIIHKPRMLDVYEHRPLLEKALSETKNRLLIISPWIRAKATNNYLINEIENLLKKGVIVYIGYGIGDGDDKKKNDADIKTEEKIKSLSARHKNFHLKDLSNTYPTHAKILISDNNYVVSTSFNWLSFKGDTNWKFRDERGIIVYDEEEIEKLFKEYSEKIRV